MEIFDVAIIGCGPSAMSSAVYCSRKGKRTIVIEPVEAFGGNFEELKMIHKLKEQALEFGAHFAQCTIHSLWCKYTPKIAYTDEGPISCKSIILAMDVSPCKLGVPLESMFHGCGLHYYDSGTCSYIKGRTVLVYGKDECAVNLAITLSALCKKLYFVYSTGSLPCSREKIDVLKNAPNIVMLPHTLIYSLEHSNKKLTGVGVIDKTTGNTGILDCQLVYVSKGIEANSKLCFPYILTDRYGFIVTDRQHKTNVDGVYAAGPIRSTILEESAGSCCSQDATMAATDGAIAAINAIKYVESLSL